MQPLAIRDTHFHIIKNT